MHNPNTTVRYVKIPGFREYEINYYGAVRYAENKKIVKPIIDDFNKVIYITLKNNFGDIVRITLERLMLKTFVGELELPTYQRDKNDWMNYTIPNLRYDIPEYFKKECEDKDEVKLAGIRFRRIKLLPKYFISETGIVYGTRNKNFNSISFDKDGYRFASFFGDNGKKKPYRIHRLVYETFVGEIPEGYVIDHFVSDKNMNNVGNLSAVTVAENNIKAYIFDDKVITYSKDDVYKILDLYFQGKSIKEICKKLNYTGDRSNDKIGKLIYSIKNGVAHQDILEYFKG